MYPNNFNHNNIIKNYAFNGAMNINNSVESGYISRGAILNHLIVSMYRDKNTQNKIESKEGLGLGAQLIMSLIYTYVKPHKVHGKHLSQM